jgi:hypothetical protein
MFRLFFRHEDNSPKKEEEALAYIGVASQGYGTKCDLTPLLTGELDEGFKNKFLFDVYTCCKVYTNKADALRDTSRRGIVDDSAYVIGLKCSVDEIENYRIQGKFSSAIVSVTDAMKKTSLPFIPKSTNDDNNHPKRQLPTLKVQ